MADLDKVIHQPARLRIMAALVAMETGSQVDFSSLGKMLELTDGNLGAHLQTLEEAGYIRVEKSFVDRKPRTSVSSTSRGRAAFDDHVEALKAIIGGNGKPTRTSK